MRYMATKRVLNISGKKNRCWNCSMKMALATKSIVPCGKASWRILILFGLVLNTTYSENAQAANDQQQDQRPMEAVGSKNGPPQNVTTEAAPLEFPINEIRVRGNTLLEKIDVELVMTPFLGADKTVNDVEAARKALEQRYKQAGYPTVMVDTPEQSVEDGTVVFKVTEVKIDNLTITGSGYFSIDRIRKEMPSLAENNVLHLPSFQEQINQLNMRSTDRTIIPVLKPGRIPGTVDVELKVKEVTPIHGNVEVDNRHSASTTATRASVMLRYDNMWQREQSLSLQYQTAPEKPKEVQVFMANYLAKIGERNLLAAYWVDSNSDVAATDAITVIGKGNVYGAREIVPLPVLNGRMHNILFGIDYKDFTDNSFESGVTSGSTPISYYQLVTQYNLNKQYEDSNHNYAGTTRFNISATYGIGALNQKQIYCTSTDTEKFDQFECKRFGAKPNYFYLRTGLSHEMPVTNGFSLYLSVQGQLADSPLISNEQFSAGGAATVRGYYESQRLGDSGYLLNVEIRSPSFGKLIAEDIDDLHYILFVDKAQLRTRIPVQSEQPKWNLRSAGIGFRLIAFKSLTAQLDWAYVYNDSDVTEGDIVPDVKRGDSRGHFEIQYEF